jgi:hypothetical protein
MLQTLLQMHSEIPPRTWWKLHKQSFCSQSKIREQELDHASLPSGTHHIILKRCYFSSDNASAKARPSSRFGLSQQDNFLNPERKADIVEVVCLAEGGSPIPGRHFLHVEAAVSWMRKHVSKAGRVSSKLTDPKKNNPYKRRHD